MLNILKGFSDLYFKSSGSAGSNRATTLTPQDIANSPLFQDIATEQFYVLIKDHDGMERRMYLTEQQMRELVGNK